MKILSTKTFYPNGSQLTLSLIEETIPRPWWKFWAECAHFYRIEASIDNEESCSESITLDKLHPVTQLKAIEYFDVLKTWKKVFFSGDDIGIVFDYVKDNFPKTMIRLHEREIEFYAKICQKYYDSGKKARVNADKKKEKKNICVKESKDTIEKSAEQILNEETLCEYFTQQAEDIKNKETEKIVKDQIKEHLNKQDKESEIERKKRYLKHLDEVLLPSWSASEDKDIRSLAKMISTQLKLTRSLPKSNEHAFAEIAKAIDEATNRIFCIEAERGYTGGLNPDIPDTIKTSENSLHDDGMFQVDAVSGIMITLETNSDFVCLSGFDKDIVSNITC